MWRFKAIFPSALSAFRLVTSVLLPFLPQALWVWLIIAAGASDVADGWLARRWNVESWLGGLLDAVADKVFVVVVLIAFVIAGNFSPLWIPFVLARELVVAVTVLYVFLSGKWKSYKTICVRTSGKLATGGQFILFLIVLLYPPGTDVALVFASMCSLWAAFDYGKSFYRTSCGQADEEQ